MQCKCTLAAAARLILIHSCVGAAFVNTAGAQIPDQYQTGPIQLQSETRTQPRPLRIHQLKIDLHDPAHELAVVVGRDPDGEGPIEAELTMPKQMAQHGNLVAAVNTNPWRMVREGVGYIVGGESNISGWAQTEAAIRSKPDHAHWSFWMTREGHARIGQVKQPGPAKLAVAGFGGLLKNGEILPKASEVRHPRTALGLDRDARWLILLVVDGRQSGYSEGVSLRELAELMLAAGCADALNLDGGGSTIMLLADKQGHLQIVNRPSGLLGARPIPVMLGVRRAIEKQN